MTYTIDSLIPLLPAELAEAGEVSALGGRGNNYLIYMNIIHPGKIYIQINTSVIISRSAIICVICRKFRQLVPADRRR